MYFKAKRKPIKMQTKKMKSLTLTVNLTRMGNLIAVQMMSKDLERKMEIRFKMSQMKMKMKNNQNNFHLQETTKTIGKITIKPKIKSQSHLNKTLNRNPSNPDKFLKRKENLTSLNDLFLFIFYSQSILKLFIIPPLTFTSISHPKYLFLMSIICE